MKNSFVVIDEKTTKYVIEVEYIFNQLIPKIMATLMPGMFKKQTIKFMERFKLFAEKHSD